MKKTILSTLFILGSFCATNDMTAALTDCTT